MHRKIFLSAIIFPFLFFGCNLFSSNSIPLDSIEITSKPDKLEYEIDDFIDLTGLEVSAVFSDGSKILIHDWTSSPEDGTLLTEPGNIKVLISYKNKSAAFYIKVNDSVGFCSDSFFWGTWVRMDNGVEHEILENKVMFNSNNHKIVDGTENTINVSGIGTFTRESDSVILCNQIPYFRKGGANLKYSLKIVGFSAQPSRAAGTGLGGIKGKGKSDKYPSFETESETDDDGTITFTAPTKDDTQTVTIENGDDLIIIPGLGIDNDGDYMGTVALVGKDDYNLKITGVISDSQKDNGYLFGNNAKEYSMKLSITNISENKCSTSVCTIAASDPKLRLSSSTKLSGFTISTLAEGTTKDIDIEVSYGEMSEPYVDTGIVVTIYNPKTDQRWEDYVPLRFYKGLVPMTIAAQSPEDNKDACLNGFIIYPDGNNQFFRIGNGEHRSIFVPSFKDTEKYKMVFSGATITTNLLDSTEMFYSLYPSSTVHQKIDVSPDDYTKLVEYISFGGNNNSEENAFEVVEPFQAYLSEGEIDFYTISADSDVFFTPDLKNYCRIAYETDYDTAPEYLFLPEGTVLTDEYLPELSDENFLFTGWYDDEELVVPGEYKVKKNATLQASWRRKRFITYISEHGNTPDEATVAEGLMITWKHLPQLYNDEYIFLGWYADSDFDEYVDDEYIIENDITLYAKWSLKRNYHLHSDGRIILDGGIADGTHVTDKDLPQITKTGYILEGWYLDEEYKTKVTAEGFVVDSDFSLWAKWSIVNYSIYYNLNGGTIDNSKVTQYNIEQTVELITPARKGYTFDGWYIDSSFTQKISRIEKGTIGNITLYAKWTIITYTITFHLNGGSFSGNQESSYTVESIPSLKSPAKNGYKFEGWYTDSSFVNVIYGIQHGTTGNIDLYAKWSLKNYTITYVLDGGTNSSDNPNIFTVEDTIILSPAKTSGRTFIGWYLEPTFTTQITTISKGTAKDITLYAKYEYPITITSVSVYNGPYINLTINYTCNVDIVQCYYVWSDAGKSPDYIYTDGKGPQSSTIRYYTNPDGVAYS